MIVPSRYGGAIAIARPRTEGIRVTHPVVVTERPTMAKGKKSTKSKAAPVEVEVEAVEVEEVDDELEELDSDEEAEAAPKKKKGNDDVEFGASDLAAHLSEVTDKVISARDLRTLLRKMARDGRITREITPGNRTRYSWSGPNDPEVKMIVKSVKGGELEQGKQEALSKLKEQKAAKQAAKAAEAAKAEKKAKKAKPAPVVDDEDDEDDDE